MYVKQFSISGRIYFLRRWGGPILAPIWNAYWLQGHVTFSMQFVISFCLTTDTNKRWTFVIVDVPSFVKDYLARNTDHDHWQYRYRYWPLGTSIRRTNFVHTCPNSVDHCWTWLIWTGVTSLSNWLGGVLHNNRLDNNKLFRFLMSYGEGDTEILKPILKFINMASSTMFA
jgi:hypothetical protein